MNGEQIVRQARDMKVAFSAKCSKFAGAVSVELLKSALAAEGIAASSRDVFVRGIPVEVDLVIPCAAQVPALGVLYEPQQVTAALEVKNSGLFGGGSLAKLRDVFGRFRAIGIQCAYVTLEERLNRTIPGRLRATGSGSHASPWPATRRRAARWSIQKTGSSSSSSCGSAQRRSAAPSTEGGRPGE
jgi:hypothetical protein